MTRLFLLSLLLSVPADAASPPDVSPSRQLQLARTLPRLEQQKLADYEAWKEIRIKEIDTEIAQILSQTTSENVRSQLVRQLTRLGALYLEKYSFNRKAQSAKSLLEKSAAQFARAKNVATLLQQEEIIYFSVLISLEKDQLKNALSLFKELEEKFPNSQYLSDLKLQLADYYFDNKKYTEALEYYNKLSSTDQILKPQADYKKAWVMTLTQQPQKAVSLFQEVIKARRARTERPFSRSLRQESLRDIVVPYAALGQSENAIEYLKEEAPEEDLPQILLDLGSLLSERKHFQASLDVFRFFSEEYPTHRECIKAHQSMISVFEHQKNRKGAIDLLTKVLPAYTPQGQWYQANVNPFEPMKAALDDFERFLTAYVTRQYEESQNTKSKVHFSETAELLKLFLTYFPESKNNVPAQMALADVYFKLTLYQDSIKAYLSIYNQSKAPENQLRALKKSVEVASVEINTHFKRQGYPEIVYSAIAVQPDKVFQAIPVVMSNLETSFVALAELLERTYPEELASKEAKLQVGYLYYLHQDYKNAYHHLYALTQKHSFTDIKYKTYPLVQDVLAHTKNYEQLVEVDKHYLEDASFQSQPVRRDIAANLRTAELNKIEQLQQKEKFAAAAESYLEYSRHYGNDDDILNEKAIYEASVCYAKAGDLTRSLEIQEKFLKTFPKSSFRESLLLQIAKAFELLAKYEPAAYYFEQFHKEYPKNPQAKSALRLAGFYYWGAQKNAKAETIFLRFLEAFPKDKDLVEADLLDLYRQDKAYEKLVRYHLAERGKKGIPVGDFVSHSLAIAEYQQQWKGKTPTKILEEAYKVANRLRVEMKETEKGTEALSKLQFWLASQKEDLFYSLKLEPPQRRLEINLQRKLSLLRDLEKEYNAVMSLGSRDWELAAIYRLANLYAHLAQVVQDAPIPPDVSGSQIETFRAEVYKNFVKPYREKAQKLSTRCLAQSESGQLSPWTAYCYAALSKTDDKKHPELHTFYLPPKFLDIPTPLPSRTDIRLGSMRAFAYPYFSFLLFHAAKDAPEDPTLLYTQGPHLPNDSSYVPVPINYSSLRAERLDILSQALFEDRPRNLTDAPTYSFLHLMVQTNPEKAKPFLLKAIESEPHNTALHELLGLLYLQQKNYSSAKVTFLSLLARGVRRPGLWNNLGVLSYLQGADSQAIEYFTHAANLEDNRAALLNLAFFSLKYRNGSEAKRNFSKAIKLEKNEIPSQIGTTIADLQTEHYEDAKEALLELTRKYKTDPYAKLSLGFFLLEAEKETEVSKRLLGEFMEENADGQESPYRKALADARSTLKNPTSSGPSDNLDDLAFSSKNLQINTLKDTQAGISDTGTLTEQSSTSEEVAPAIPYLKREPTSDEEAPALPDVN